MKTLIYGAGPIGRWLALRLHQAGRDVTLLARGETYRSLQKSGLEIVDGLTGERLAAGVELVERLEPEDRFDLVVDIDGWLKYHFAFMAPTAGVIFEKGGDMGAVAADREAIHRYCRACREAGDVLRRIGYRRRQPPVFNLYYWLPHWLEPVIFRNLFGSRSGEVRFGLHARTVGPELLEMAQEFAELKAEAGIETPSLDALLDCVPRPRPSTDRKEVS